MGRVSHDIGATVIISNGQGHHPSSRIGLRPEHLLREPGKHIDPLHSRVRRRCVERKHGLDHHRPPRAVFETPPAQGTRLFKF